MTYIYKNPTLYDIYQIEYFINEEMFSCAIDGIIGLSLYGNEREPIKNFIFKLIISKNMNKEINHALIKSLSNIARIDKNLTNADIQYIRKIFKEDEYLKGAISDLVDDYYIFCK